MAKSKKHNVYVTTPPVPIIYTYIDRVDEGRTHEGQNISDGMYKATLVLDPLRPDHKELIDLISETNDKHYALAGLPNAEKYTRLVPQVDDDGKVTGKMLVTAKSQFEIDLLDGRNEPLPHGTYVGWGSIVNAKLCLRPTTYQKTMAGSTINLNGMRILELVRRDDYGDPVEGAFDGSAIRERQARSAARAQSLDQRDKAEADNMRSSYQQSRDAASYGQPVGAGAGAGSDDYSFEPDDELPF